MMPSVVPDSTQITVPGQDASAGKLLSLRKIAEILNCHRETVRRIVKSGELTYVQRPGCSIRVPQSALEEYMERYTWAAQGNHQDLNVSEEKKTGTSVMDGKSLARGLRMKRKQNVS